MRNLSAFLKTSILATSVCAAFSVTAMATNVSVIPLPTNNPPQWLGPDLVTPWHINTGAANPTFKCGTIYMGSIDVSSSSGITLEALGCAAGNNPVIINAQPLNGDWSEIPGTNHVFQRYVDLKDHNNALHDVGQVFADSQFLPLAHYPNSYSEEPTPTATPAESGWLQYNPNPRPSYSASTDYKFPFANSNLPDPNDDIVGAKLTFRGWNNPYNIGTRTVSDYSNGVITLKAYDPVADYDLPAEDPGSVSRFYLEGKLWMLLNSTSQTGWAYDHNTHMLYVRMPNGVSPDGHIFAGPYTKRTIDARGSSGITLHNMRIVGGDIGIDGGWLDTAVAPDGTKGTAAVNLHLYNDEIDFSGFAAVYATHTVGLNMAYSKVVGALHSGVYARSDSKSGRFTGNEFDYVGNVDMHKGGQAALYVNNDGDLQIVDNTFNQIGKTAIWTGASTYAVAYSNHIYGACIIHGDCGGIYLRSGSSSAPALYTRIHDNVVTGVTGTVGMRVGGDPSNLERYAIYLDDYSTNAYIYRNTITGNATGMQIHHGIKNYIMGNIFKDNSQRHILFSNSSGDAEQPSGIIGSGNYVGTGGAGAPITGFSDVVGNTFWGTVQAFWVISDTTSSAANTVTFNGNTYQNYSGTSSIGSPALNYK